MMKELRHCREGGRRRAIGEHFTAHGPFHGVRSQSPDCQASGGRLRFEYAAASAGAATSLILGQALMLTTNHDIRRAACHPFNPPPEHETCSSAQ